jgi:hypothetical protein
MWCKACKKYTIYIQENKKTCDDCLENKRERNRRYRMKHKEKIRQKREAYKNNVPDGKKYCKCCHSIKLIEEFGEFKSCRKCRSNGVARTAMRFK